MQFFHLLITRGDKDSDTCIVNVTWINLAPTANAGPDQTVPHGGTVRLDANASQAADDGIAAYLSFVHRMTSSMGSPNSNTVTFNTIGRTDDC